MVQGLSDSPKAYSAGVPSLTTVFLWCITLSHSLLIIMWFLFCLLKTQLESRHQQFYCYSVNKKGVWSVSHKQHVYVGAEMNNLRLPDEGGVHTFRSGTDAWHECLMPYICAYWSGLKSSQLSSVTAKYHPRVMIQAGFGFYSAHPPSVMRR